MKILYIYPHPDDESFGSAHAMSKQLREGHEVYLLTLTKGGATKQRFKYNLSIEEMGEVRFKEMLNVEKALKLSGMTVLDFVDSGMKETDPREIEEAIQQEILKLKPNVLVTYPVHGISGFHDHIICHSLVKRVFVELKETQPYLKRLAFFTVDEEIAKESPWFKLSFSTENEIDCIIETNNEDVEAAYRALDCYVTFQETIINTGVKDLIAKKKVYFEIYQENFTPPVNDLFYGLD